MIRVFLALLNIMLILKLVNSYKKVKWYDKAIRLCVEADDHFPDNADILFNTGAMNMGCSRGPQRSNWWVKNEAANGSFT